LNFSFSGLKQYCILYKRKVRESWFYSGEHKWYMCLHTIYHCRNLDGQIKISCKRNRN
jgi:hypothetical protein